MKMSTEHLWNYSGEGKNKNFELVLSQPHCIHRKPHMDWRCIVNRGPRQLSTWTKTRR